MKLLIGIILLPYFTFAGFKYHSENLSIMDIESIERLVSEKLAIAKRAKTPANLSPQGAGGESVDEGQGQEALKDAVKLVFARPVQDSSTSLVYNTISTTAEEYKGIDRTLELVTDEALNYLDQSGDAPELLKAQNTSIYVLKNMMEELIPRVKDDKDERIIKLLKKIRDKDISYSNALKNHNLLYGPKRRVDLSEMASQIVGKKKKSWWNIF